MGARHPVPQGPTLYTIGHSNRSFEHFASLLHQHGIDVLVDVRSRPYSRFVPHFNKRPVSEALRAHAVRYLFLGNELGGKLGDEYRDAQGNLDYARRAQAPDFRAGLGELMALAESHAAAIMCAEEDPRQCHRRLLVTPPLLGVAVVHIRGDGRLEREDDLRCGASQMPLF